MRRRGAIVASIAVGLVVCTMEACDVEVERVQLQLPEDGGFGCASFASRATDAGDLAMVIDVFEVVGDECRFEFLLDSCGGDGCMPDPVQRTCIDLEVPDPAPGSLPEAVARVGAQLADSDWELELSEQSVVLRGVLVAQTCDEVASSGVDTVALSCSRLVGCGYACPLRRGDVSQTVTLTLGELSSNSCEAATEVCASPRPAAGIQCSA